MKILITGVAGFLGSHLADALIKEGHDVRGVDNLSGGDTENIPSKVEFVEGDCTDIHLMRAACGGVDVVYHAACAPHEGLSFFSPAYITESVFGATMTTLSAAIQEGVGRFVYLSSMARYGTQETYLFNETMEPKPQDPYGVAKYAAELAIKALCDVHDMEYVIAVPHSIIGTRQKYDDPYRNVASIFINLMLQGKTPCIYGDGKQLRSFSFISDVVEPLVLMATASDAVGEIFNIGPDMNEISILDLYYTIADLIGFIDAPIFLEERPGEVRNATCSANKARFFLGYEAKKETTEGLQEMINDIKRKGTRPFVYHLPIEIKSDKMPKTWSKRLY